MIMSPRVDWIDTANNRISTVCSGKPYQDLTYQDHNICGMVQRLTAWSYVATCAPEIEPKGLAGLIIGCVYIMVGCVIMVTGPICAG